MEASRGSMCWLFWVLTYTHAFYQIPHPCINNAVLDYSSRIWIYLRRAPIKVQIGRSTRPTHTPPFPISGVCCWNAVVCAWLGCRYTAQNTKIESMNSRSAKFLCIYLSVLNINACCSSESWFPKFRVSLCCSKACVQSTGQVLLLHKRGDGEL